MGMNDKNKIGQLSNDYSYMFYYNIVFVIKLLTPVFSTCVSRQTILLVNGEPLRSERVNHSNSNPFNNTIFLFQDPSNIAREFSTGYLLGELLNKHGLQEDFSFFSQNR